MKGALRRTDVGFINRLPPPMVARGARPLKTPHLSLAITPAPRNNNTTKARNHRDPRSKRPKKIYHLEQSKAPPTARRQGPCQMHPREHPSCASHPHIEDMRLDILPGSELGLNPSHPLAPAHDRRIRTSSGLLARPWGLAVVIWRGNFWKYKGTGARGRCARGQ